MVQSIGGDDHIAQAHSRAAAVFSAYRIGVAYIGPPAGDSGTLEWRGVVAVSDGTSITEALVVARSMARNAPFDSDALAATVERIVARRGGISHMSRPDWSGPGILLENHVDVELHAMFPLL